MSIASIKLNFIEYLMKYNLIPKEKIQEESSGSKNIFEENFEFFKDYLLEQLSTDPESFMADFSIIEDMDFGEKTDEESEDIKKQLIDKLLEKMYADPNVISLLDKNHDGQLNEEEKATLENFIKGEGSEINIEDLQKAYDAIRSGTFRLPESVDTGSDNIFTSGTGDDTTVNPPSSGGTNPPSTDPNNPSSSTPPTTTTEEKDYSKMSKSDLQTELTSAQSELSTAQTNYQNVMSGSDSTLQTLEGNVKTTYETYQAQVKAVDETMAAQLDTAVQNVSEKQASLDAKSLEVSNNKTALSQAQTAFDNAEATFNSIDAARTKLQNTSTNGMTEEQISQFNSKKAEVEAKYTAALQAKNDAKTKLDQAKTTLETSEAEETTMQTDLDEAKAAQAQIEADIAAAHPEVAAAQKAYDDAKTAYDTKKAELASAAEQAVRAAETKISKIESAMNAIDIKDDEKNNVFRLEGEPKTAEEMNLTAQYIPRGQDSDLPYVLIGPNPPEEGKEYPVLVFCPGMAQFGTGEKGMFQDTTPAGVMFDRDGQGNTTYDWNLQGFEGYIVIPQLSGNQHWNSEWTSTQVKSIIDNLGTNHNITRGQTVLAGASAGVGGVSGIGSRLGSEYFSDVVFISGHPNTNGLDGMNVYGYYAEFGEENVRVAMKGRIDENNTTRVESFRDSSDKITEKANHNSVVKLLFNHDDDNNGLSDFLEKFFPEYYHS